MWPSMRRKAGRVDDESTTKPKDPKPAAALATDSRCGKAADPWLQTMLRFFCPAVMVELILLLRPPLHPRPAPERSAESLALFNLFDRGDILDVDRGEDEGEDNVIHVPSKAVKLPHLESKARVRFQNIKQILRRDSTAAGSPCPLTTTRRWKRWPKI